MLQSNPAMQSASVSANQTWLNSEQSMSSKKENTVSNRQLWLIGHAVLAFTAVLCCGGSPFMFASLAWFGVSLHLCQKGGIK